MARGGQAGTALCAYHPPPSAAGLTAAAEGCFPPLLQQPTSNRPLGATAQAPATGADNARLPSRTDVVTTAQRGSRAHPSVEGSLGFFRLFFIFSAPKGLTPNTQSATLNKRVYCVSGAAGFWGERIKVRPPLIGSKGVHSQSPARAKLAQPIRARTDWSNPIRGPG
jgi:hypothetical protein